MKYYVWAERLTDYYWSSPFTKLRDALEEAKDVFKPKDGDTALWMLAILYCTIYHVDNDIFMLSVIFISMFCIILL